MEYLALVVTGLLTLYNVWLIRGARRELQRVNPERLTRLVDELVATAEEASAAVSERTERLEEVLKRADLATAALASPPAPAAGAPLRTEAAPPEATTAAVLAERRGAHLSHTHPPTPASADPVQPARAPVQSWEPAELAAPDEPTGEVSRADVYALADRGLDSRSIARRLGITRGEVETILGLRRFN